MELFRIVFKVQFIIEGLIWRALQSAKIHSPEYRRNTLLMIVPPSFQTPAEKVYLLECDNPSRRQNPRRKKGRPFRDCPFQLSSFACQLLTVNCQLSATSHELPASHFSLSTVNCPLSTISYQLPASHFSLSTLDCSLSTISYQP